MTPDTWNILLLDDDEDDYLLTRDMLDQAQGRKIYLDWSSDIKEAWQLIKEQKYDAILVDYDLGEATGLDFIREVCAGHLDAPLILYTGRGSYTVDLESMQAGAALYLTKLEVNPLLLERSIRYAIERKQAELKLLEREQVYRQIFDAMQEGYGLHEIICDENGKPVDYRFLELNTAYERITGLRAEDILGKSLLEVLPGIESYWIEIFGAVALTGKPARFEQYTRVLNKHFEVCAFCPRPGQFATIFSDITERKRAN